MATATVEQGAATTAGSKLDMRGGVNPFSGARYPNSGSVESNDDSKSGQDGDTPAGRSAEGSGPDPEAGADGGRAASASADGDDGATNTGAAKADEGAKGTKDEGSKVAFRYHALPEDQIPEEKRDWAFIGENGKTAYRDLEAWARGTEEKDREIQRRGEAIEAERKKAADLEGRVKFLEQHLSDDQVLASLVEKHLPEEFRGQTEESIRQAIEDSDELDETEITKQVVDKLAEFKAAKRIAEKEAKAEVESFQAEDQKRQQQFEQSVEAAKEKIDAIATDAFFGVETTEDRDLLADVIKEFTDPLGNSPIQQAAIVSALGPESAAGELILHGLKSRYQEKRMKRLSEIQGRIRVERETPAEPGEKPAPKKFDPRNSHPMHAFGGARQAKEQGRARGTR